MCPSFWSPYFFYFLREAPSFLTDALRTTGCSEWQTREGHRACSVSRVQPYSIQDFQGYCNRAIAFTIYNHNCYKTGSMQLPVFQASFPFILSTNAKTQYAMEAIWSFLTAFVQKLQFLQIGAKKGFDTLTNCNKVNQ